MRSGERLGAFFQSWARSYGSGGQRPGSVALQMARNRIVIEAPRARVFGVLSDPSSYGHWVVGSKEIRAADSDWPARGSKFHHTVGLGPLTIEDHTLVEEVDAPRCLVLRARSRPLGAARVALHLENDQGRTRVTMDEHPVGGLPVRLLAKVVDPLLHARNTKALQRLKALVEAD